LFLLAAFKKKFSSLLNKTKMPQTTVQQWNDYMAALSTYNQQVREYIAARELGENPNVPLPPKPPSFTGWAEEN
jgi:hypothetical protein